MPGKPVVKVGWKLHSYTIFFAQNYESEAQKTLTGGTECRVRFSNEWRNPADERLRVNSDQAENAQNEAAGFFP
jgi:hypothetical protein